MQLKLYSSTVANHTGIGGRNSSVGSVLGSLSCVMQRREFDPALSFRWRVFFFSLRVNMSSDSIPPPPPPPPRKNSRMRVYTEVWSVDTCIPSQGLKRSWSCPRRVNAGNKNTPSMHHPRRQNVTTSIVGINKNGHTRKNLTQNNEPHKYSWERRLRRRNWH